jgi:putative lipase involved disintegration of autophagic bodies
VPEPTDGPWGASAARKRAQVAWGADPKAPTCSKPCLSTALVQKSLYYPAATDLFNNVSYAFPDADIWVRRV